MPRTDMTAITRTACNSVRRHSALTVLGVLALLSLLVSCHEDSDDYYTTIAVRIRLPEGCNAERMQGTVKLTNLNNRLTYATSEFDGTAVTLQVMRGVYAIDAEGSLRYTDDTGQTLTGNFRASTSYCEALEHPSSVELDIVFM